VLVSVGEAVDVSSHLADYRGEPAKALHALTTAIQAAMAREVVDVERIDMATLACAVEALYRGEVERELWGELEIADRSPHPFPASASIADVAEHFRKLDPGRIERLWQRILGYQAGLRWTPAFFLSLPLGGLVAYRYLVGTGRLRHQLRFGALLLTRAQEARRLLAERREILDELGRAGRDYRARVNGSRA
jgi:hypothetical protein